MDAARAARHASMRWIGVPLFALGAIGVVCAIAAVAMTDLRLGTILLYVGATGFSLGTFGTHNDTALALAQRARPEDLSASLRAELERDLKADKTTTSALAATPKAAWFATVGALLLHGVGAWRLASVALG
jgi:hypothetical protein